MKKREGKPSGVHLPSLNPTPQMAGRQLEDSIDLKKRILNGTAEEIIEAVREATKKEDSGVVPALIDALIAIDKEVRNGKTSQSRANELDDLLETMMRALKVIPFTKEQIHDIIGKLDDTEESARKTAALALTLWVDPNALPVFIGMLQHYDPEIVDQGTLCIINLVKSGHDCSSAEEQLFKSLRKTGHTQLRRSIMDALNAIGVSDNEIQKKVIDFQDLSNLDERIGIMAREHFQNLKAPKCLVERTIKRIEREVPEDVLERASKVLERIWKKPKN